MYSSNAGPGAGIFCYKEKLTPLLFNHSSVIWYQSDKSPENPLL